MPATDSLGLSDKLLLIEASLSKAGLPHAFGGAIALAYYATPRATIDIDVNVFVGSERASELLSTLETLGVTAPTPEERHRLERDGQVRVFWVRTPVDLFLSYDPLHDACLARRRLVPFGDGDSIHVLSAEDLIVFKAIFDRSKDWRDIDEALFAMGEEIDHSRISAWLRQIVGEDDPRFERWREAQHKSLHPDSVT